MKINSMYVKKIVVTEIRDDEGMIKKYKAILQEEGGDVQIVINDLSPIELTEGEKGIVVDIKATQTKLKWANSKTNKLSVMFVEEWY